ncbi:hypothetical protein MCOR27_010815 [Pyricularia oryzae]|uniref:Zn(2)-C6 fungal-type domain-containing protein n=1 Tax=Pyricularia grisea TaxID=148305 RepID=A0ABQ8NCL2_PYRGI|nr:hypothetical protein MCOR01_008916 [Pyricularia oryzae]KAI6294863.1 hypothetical protein MCOR33_008096 [Pyricularia grisea]KAI6258669.1 hypothetical protein MCOR19_004965 [Pyricularia oryzae]KAI6266932.1 hypothetical protein MCOR27_010815 [Pyricularia oryzae]KAI6274769.1 hypothetical protein MCOR26_006322 [Pyricularia oryzae]
MGRKPNALILQFFERGPKLADNSNRYPHTCKSCGENFPKGRIDSLTNHLTRKCPAISESDRVRACLTIHGFNKAAVEHTRASVASATAAAAAAVRPPADIQQDLDLVQRDWTALETLAEVSRQIDLSEKHDDRGNPAGASLATESTLLGQDIHDQFLAQSAHLGYKDDHSLALPQEATAQEQAAIPGATLPGTTLPAATDAIKEEPTAEQQLEALIQSAEQASHSAALSVAAAATARLNPSLLDPQLREDGVLAAVLPTTEARQTDEALEPVPTGPSQPWGELTQSDLLTTVPLRVPSQGDNPLVPQLLHGPIKGGFRMSSPNGGKARHSRARFDATRRKEVQEVRKIGACIRCRILRKTCSKGHPCDTCRKVLSPRIWKSGCVRTKFSEQLDLYSAGVQIVLNQQRLNDLKAHVNFANQGTTLELSIFPECNFHISAQALQSIGAKERTPEEPERPWVKEELLLIDSEKEDLQGSVELYMRQILHEFVEREKSHFARVTLDTAITLGHETHDELLKKAIELWGLVEMLDRERQWNITVKYGGLDGRTREIKDSTDQDCFTTICLQLTAAAERKAAHTSKQLLQGMQRVLQDSKTKIDHNMFFTTLILLNCVEKTTWAFKAWEQDSLQPMWPLEKAPHNFTGQGYVLADLLKMLLGIRKVLPRTFCRESDGMLATHEEESVLQGYFHNLELKFADLQAKQEQPIFSPTDSRSLELLFCSTLLLSAAE